MTARSRLAGRNPRQDRFGEAKARELSRLQAELRVVEWLIRYLSTGSDLTDEKPSR
ncbi:MULTISPECIES: hypothetical protein [Hyphomicrobiales]|jgi:hypothetical protein|uniref:hypothetical protein n=1 Tax=Methylobacterium sp. CCH7-A2 TaxID=1768789 RepID=UPI000AD815D1|nr:MULTISPECIES: hypothetical protein [Hyphomicrobiales]